MLAYQQLLQQSIEEPDLFWSQQAQRIEWQRIFSTVRDLTDARYPQWFADGMTNLCHNAVDRHLASRGEQAALIFYCAETDDEQQLSYRQLHREVNIMAAILINLGVQQGDRVLIYLPMIKEAAIAMLACARIGAVHAVVFGGFAPASLAKRIDDAEPTLIICADAGFLNGKVINYKHLMESALDCCNCLPNHLLMIDRGISPCESKTGRDIDYSSLRQRFLDAEVPCTWMPASAASYILYTSGTTGNPKGVLRDTGGYTVALATSLDLLFDAKPGDVMFTTSDLGWVVGHSYGLYGPLLAGMTSVQMEGSPLRPDPGIWWRLVERYQVRLMLSSATAMRLLKRHGFGLKPLRQKQSPLASLKTLFLAGEPLDEATTHYIEHALDIKVVDHYWQTETGAPIIALPAEAGHVGTDARCDRKGLLQRKTGSPGIGCLGYQLLIVDEETGKPCRPDQKGLLMIEGPLPPGCLTTLWRQDNEYRRLYWSQHQDNWRYSTFDYAIADEFGHITLLGRTDDVINVAGKRIGTREIEEILLHDEAVSEVAVVGMPHDLRGQVPVVFAVLRQAIPDTARELLERHLKKLVCDRLGNLARPKHILFVEALPRTRSGKVLRRVIQEVMTEKNDSSKNLSELEIIIADLSQALRGEVQVTKDVAHGATAY